MAKQERTNQDAAYFMKLRDNVHSAMAQVHKVRERQNQSQRTVAKEPRRR